MWLLSINFLCSGYKSCVKSAKGFLFVCLVLRTEINMFFVKILDEFARQCLMLWVRAEHTQLDRLRSSCWCVPESSETARETQLCNSSHHPFLCMCWSQLQNLGNAGCRLIFFDVTKMFVQLLVVIWWLHLYVLRSEQRWFGWLGPQTEISDTHTTP